MATKKDNKPTQMDRYRAIMENKGIRDFKVFFSFNKESECNNFHFDLMAEQWDKYYLFDGPGKIAHVLVPGDGTNSEIVCDLAARYGGEKTTPNLR